MFINIFIHAFRGKAGRKPYVKRPIPAPQARYSQTYPQDFKYRRNTPYGRTVTRPFAMLKLKFFR
jgi:hypothetical protein